MKKPNLLWILTDQQSFNMMSCAGNPYLSTPNMDYLAKKGVMFTQAYCGNPVCLPSRFSMFTGHYPGDVGLRSNEFRQEMEGLPEQLLADGFGTLLREAGYETVYGGKEHFPYMRAEDLGFTYLCEDEREELAEVCAGYLKSYDGEKPFAMVASFINPHDICLMAISDFASQCGEADQKIAELFHRETLSVKEAQKLPEGMHPDIFFETVCPPLPENYQPAPDEPEAVALLQEQRRFKKLAREQYTDRQWRLHRWAYARLTEQADRQIGVVLKALLDVGLWDDTVILFTSDHGDMDASHKMEHKTALYQECCHVPFVIKGLSDQAGVRREELVQNGTDCICTLLDYAGADRPGHLTGRSLREGVETGVWKEERDCVVIESEFGVAAVGRDYKYVRYSVGERAEQFYDLKKNPGETYNQLAKYEGSEALAGLKEAVNRHLAERQERAAGLKCT